MKSISKVIIALIIPCLFYTEAKAEEGPVLVPLNIINDRNSKSITIGLVIADNVLTSGYFLEKDKLANQYNHGEISYYKFRHQAFNLAFGNLFKVLISCVSSKAFITGYKVITIIDPPSQPNQ